VSPNYRLGPFGWLSTSQYDGALKEATNLGLQDIITALQWVRKNIAQFGGDPNNVTVTGHSGGAYSTIGLLAAPAADGLYHHLDGKLLAETLIKVSPRDIGDRLGVDNTTIGIVDDHTQPGAVLTETPLRVLETGKHRDVDILFSSAEHEADWWVINKTDDFDPGSIDNLVTELATTNRIPRSRGRRIIAAYDVDDRTPVEVRGALFTDYFFTLPAVRGALAHAAARRNAHLLTIGPTEGAHAVHGTEMYGIVARHDQAAATSRPSATPSSATPYSHSDQVTPTSCGTP
jgi:para-nitrobenzyl esterase